jgi:hypothetical protein
MKVSQKIREIINNLPMGKIINYQQLDISNKEYGAAAKALERLIAQKIIKRVSTGVFYKPKKTVFGELKPGEDDLLRPYLFIGKNRVAYVTGTALYNKMGLTTQVPKNIKVSSRVKEVRTQIGNIKVRRVKSYIDVTNKNYHLLEILDVLKDFKQIPDLNKKRVLKQITEMIAALKKKEFSQILKYGIEYPPRVRAFLGALLENINPDRDLMQLEKTLNPLTNYDLGISKDILPSAQNWNIR